MRVGLVLVIVFLAITGCATNPVTGRSELTFVGESKEIAIGREQYLPAQQTQGGLYQVDKSLTRYVNEVGGHLAAVSDRALPYEFVVLNNSIPNAWALPGGKIAVNRGLLVSLSNEAELAAVLAHEIVHAAARHGAKAVERDLLLQGVVRLTEISVSDFEHGNYIVGGAQLGAQLLTQRYSRKAELEADQYGMQYMARAGYNPGAAVTLQQKFVALSEGKSRNWIEGLFASHPPSAERVRKNTEHLLMIGQDGFRDWDLGESRYTQQLAYLQSKKAAYQAFDQANTLLADKEVDVAMSRLDQALMDEPNEPRFHGLKADILLDQGKLKAAISDYNGALAIDDQYYEYYLGRGISWSKLGNRAMAIADLEKSNDLLPTAIATNELGNLSLAVGNNEEAKNYFRKVMSSSGPLRESARAAFVRLDLADNPEAYFSVQSEIMDGNFVSVISNASGQSLRALVVRFSATINGDKYQVTRSTGPLAARGEVRVYPGWKLKSEDTVTNIYVRVQKAKL